MHLMQGSDAHSLETEQADSANKRLGVGARVTEILVREASFASLKELLMGSDFTRMRPARGASPWEFAEKARQEGSNREQAFHERTMTKTSRTRPILHDAVAFANSGGGTIYVGMHADPQLPVHGLDRPEEDVRMLKIDIQRTVEPALEVDFDIKQSGTRAIIVMTVPDGEGKPYVYNPTGQIFLRGDRETTTATRDEIIALVRGATPSQDMRPGARPRPAAEEPYVAPSRRTGISEGEPAAATPVPTVPQTARPERSEPRRGEDRDRDWGRDRDRARSGDPDGRQTSDGGRRSSEDEPQPRGPEAAAAASATRQTCALAPPGEPPPGEDQGEDPADAAHGRLCCTGIPRPTPRGLPRRRARKRRPRRARPNLSPLRSTPSNWSSISITSRTPLCCSMKRHPPPREDRAGTTAGGVHGPATATTPEAEPESTPTEPLQPSRSNRRSAVEAARSVRRKLLPKLLLWRATISSEHETREESVEKAAASTRSQVADAETGQNSSR